MNQVINKKNFILDLNKNIISKFIL